MAALWTPADGESAPAESLTDPAVVDLRPWDAERRSSDSAIPRRDRQSHWEAHLYAFDALEHHVTAPRFTGDGQTALWDSPTCGSSSSAGRERLTDLCRPSSAGFRKRTVDSWRIERMEFDVLREEGNPDVRR